MKNLLRIILLTSGLTAYVFSSCKPEISPFDVSPAESLDPQRAEMPYPAIAVPLDVDMESPQWKGIDLSSKPPVIPVSANEQLKSFVLQPGYKLEPVLSEPQIREPAAIQFDGNGRMYVLELRTYMQDIDANGELFPTSRISRWEDLDEDGVYETGVVFLDSLIFPRFIVPFGPHSILSMESNEDHIYRYTDTDGDGKSDKKELFATGLGRSGNVEHQTSFMTWTLDNWMYSTYNSKRIRWTPAGIIQENTGNPYGQWGVTQDNYGQVWFQDGAGGVPQNFQFPIVYGNFKVDGQFKDGFRIPYSLVKLADFEPGMREAKTDGSLNNVTCAAGNDVFRGDRLPKELIGQYFYGEPVGRIVRQVKSEKEAGLTYLQNQYIAEESEFIQSTDPLFRPVDMATAPDGTMYIVDMYRGIIQEGNWTQEGSYLRTKIKQYQLDDVIGNGRIWRVTYDGIPRSLAKPRMYEETTAELVRHLEHPNGWWRDQAQQNIILRQDKSVLNELEKMLSNSENELARIHALWTLEGLGGLKLQTIKSLMKDSNPNIQIQALRASETLYKYGSKELAVDYRNLANHPNPSIAIQAIQSAYILKIDAVDKLLRDVFLKNPSKGVQSIANQLIDKLEEANKSISTLYSSEEQVLFASGKIIFDNYCASCHGIKGLGSPTGNGELLAPAFSGSKRILGHPEYAVKTLLHGLKGSIEGKEYEGVMIAMDTNDDQWMASVISYIRNDFGNKGSFVKPEFVAEIRKETAVRKSNYRFEELISEIPKVIFPQENWRVTASSTALQGVGSTKDPFYAFGFKGWKSEITQEPGIWFRIELPKEQNITELSFESGEKEFPKGFILSVSSDGTNWKKVGEAAGVKNINTIKLDSYISSKFIQIQTTKKGEHPWSMKNLTLYVR